MRQKVKSYLAFTSFLYRIAVFLLIPAGVIGIGFWAGRDIGEPGVILAAVLLPVTEITSDNWLFGGIQVKNSKKLDCLKISARGMGILKNALILDLIRKFLTALGTLLLCYLAIWASHRQEDEMDMAFSGGGVISANGWQGVGILLYFILLSCFASVLGTFLSRYSGMVWYNIMIGYIAMILVVVCIFLLALSEFIFIIDVVFGVLCILAGMLTVRVAMKKVEGGYYDC